MDRFKTHAAFDEHSAGGMADEFENARLLYPGRRTDLSKAADRPLSGLPVSEELSGNRKRLAIRVSRPILVGGEHTERPVQHAGLGT